MSRVAAWTDGGLGVVLAVSLAAEVVLAAGVVGLRAFTGQSIDWADEVTAILVMVIAFVGAASAFRRGTHMGADLLPRWPQRWRSTAKGLGLVAMAVFAAVTAWEAVDVGRQVAVLHLPVTGWSVEVMYIPMAVGLALIVGFAIEKLFGLGWRHSVVSLTIAGAVGFAIWLAHDALVSLVTVQPIAYVLLASGVGICLGMPIAFAMGSSALLVMLLSHASLNLFPQNMYSGLGNVLLVSIPLFMFSGNLLASPQMSERLMRPIEQLTMPWSAGPGVAAVGSIYLVSGASGAKLADVAAVGPVLRKSMLARGYSADEIVGIMTASAVMGEAVPPSIAMLVLASVTTSVSTGKLFLAGLLPAALIAALLIILVIKRAKRRGLRGSARPPGAEIARAVAGSVIPFGVVLIVFGGIISGLATPEQAAGLGSAYGLAATVVVYRTPLRDVAKMAVDAARFAGALLFLLAAASAFVWVMIVGGISVWFTDFASYFAGDPRLYMLASIAVIIVAGMFFEGLPALIVLVPLLMPNALTLHINPLQYSILLLVGMGLGAFLPPLGVSYYGVRSILRLDSGKSHITLLYLAVVLLGLVILALIPQITTFLPQL